MKKISLLLMFVISAMQFAFAEGDPKVSTDPASFTVYDAFTVTIDVSGTDVEGQTELYLWTWLKTGVDGDQDINGIGNWSESGEDFKLTATADPNIFTFDYAALESMTDYGKLGNIKQLGLLVKTKDGSAQTNDYLLDLEPIVFEDEPCRLFPSKVTLDDIITVIFNKTLTNDLNVRLMEVKSVEVTLKSSAGDYVSDKMSVVENAQGTVQYTFKPELLFPDQDFSEEGLSLTFKFYGITYSVDGKEQEVATGDYQKNVL